MNKVVFLQVTDSTSAHNYNTHVLYEDAKVFLPECTAVEYCIVHRSKLNVPPVSSNIYVDWERMLAYMRKRGELVGEISLETSSLIYD